VLRPYPVATAGKPLEVSFDYQTKEFNYRFQHDPKVMEPTLIYLPSYQYPEGCRVVLSDGRYELKIKDQILHYWHTEDLNEHKISIFLE
ncbi:MAG: hypothetical protein J7L35_00225, partial [Anaerolineales bacterium]|nr:hypothetical protein [Anaerolineales bacterium]